MNSDTPLHEAPELAAIADEAAAAAQRMVQAAKGALAPAIAPGGRVDPARLDAPQYTAHGFAWLATYAEGLAQMTAWAGALKEQGRFGDLERLILCVGGGEYLRQMAGGMPMSQGEVIRPDEAGVPHDALAAFTADAAVCRLSAANTEAARASLAELLAVAEGAATFGATGLDEEMELVRAQFRRFADERVVPHAHGWHLRDELIPLELIAEMAELGVFGLTIPEEWGGAGMGKTAMCVVSEELSRGYIGVGSLGTRSEIAAELILGGGTAEQKAEWLPKIAAGEVLPTAVFTEPDVGSDLGALRTRAERTDDGWTITGTKTWITHAARADLMTLLARTDPATDDYRGLSMFLAAKTRGTDADPFPDAGLDGEEIPVIGYRGMKEYTLSFDRFPVSAGGLLGGEAGLGQGFRQLMRTFESARIQTAARAIGVAQSALELSLRYAQERKAFGRPLIAFPRVAAKLAMMAAEIMIARQLTYHAAREKDAGHRCDLEAGMAKLLAARVAWAAADNGVQIHGGNGFALEYPVSRVLCDARILSIFEGAAEIQAQVIARRLLGAN